MLKLVGLDADDTLWHDLSCYDRVERELLPRLHAAGSPEALLAQLERIEAANVERYGYGPNSYALSVLELILGRPALADDAARLATEALALIERHLLGPVALVDGVARTLRALAGRWPLVVLTKGEPFHQRRKLRDSGLAPLVEGMIVMGDKSPEEYRSLLAARGVAPEAFVMVGNSPRSDLDPVLALGGWAVHVPSPRLWEHEAGARPLPPPGGRLHRIDSITALPGILAAIEAQK